jgi:hypothetical protein
MQSTRFVKREESLPVMSKTFKSAGGAGFAILLALTGLVAAGLASQAVAKPLELESDFDRLTPRAGREAGRSKSRSHGPRTCRRQTHVAASGPVSGAGCFIPSSRGEGPNDRK